MRLERLEAGMQIPYGGDRVAEVPPELADAFEPGDRLVVVQDSGALLHIRSAVWTVAHEAVGAATDAFSRMGTIADDQIDRFFLAFADNLADPDRFAPIAEANAADVERARRRGRSSTRLVLSEKMRADMVDGLRGWADRSEGRNEVIETIEHPGWKAELVRSGLGVVGFVFEGRPNVFADACGVIRSGNTVVFRIGSDALGTAEAIVEHALDPAIEAAGLPAGAATLVASPERSAGWAMFSDPRLSLAVARGSGAAVAQLGAVARQAGVPVSLHGTGGAWIVAAPGATPEDLAKVVFHSLDRKVCNTLNTLCVTSDRAHDLIPAALQALEQAGTRLGTNPKLHVVEGQEHHLPEDWFREVTIRRAEGDVVEPKTGTVQWNELGQEWEWEESPEITLAVVDTIDEAVGRFNETSPRFVASLVGGTPEEEARFFGTVDAPFVGNGFTRWVDGQYALKKPELGLSNWQFGRLFGRGGVLSGDSVFTVRIRVSQDDLDIGR